MLLDSFTDRAGSSGSRTEIGVADVRLDYRSAVELVDAMAAGQVSAVELNRGRDSPDRALRRNGQCGVCAGLRPGTRGRQRRRRRTCSRRGPAAARGPDDGQGVVPHRRFADHVGHTGVQGFRVGYRRCCGGAVKAAGAVVLGKTNVPLGPRRRAELQRHLRDDPQPVESGAHPRGSSGAQLPRWRLGTERCPRLGHRRSLRNPAHFCGIYAHKPTIGLLPTPADTRHRAFPVLPGESDLAVIGPMARSAADLSLMLDILAERTNSRSRGVPARTPEPRHAEPGRLPVLVFEHPPV